MSYPPPPGGGYPVPGGYDPMAPYGLDPATGVPYSDKQKTTVGLLQLVLSVVGLPGVGRLYAGHTAIGLVQLIGVLVSYVLVCLFIGIFTAAGIIIWGVVDGILMLTQASPRDGAGRVLRP